MLIELSSDCNSNCLYCFRNKDRKHYMDFKDYVWIIENQYFRRVTKDPNPYLVGRGEPLTHPDFFTLVSYPTAGRKTISTNGKLIDKNNAQMLCNCVHNIQISLDSLDPKKLLELRDIDLEYLLETIDLVKKSMHSWNWLQINFLISEKNIDEINDMCEFALIKNIPVSWEIKQNHFIKSNPKSKKAWEDQKKLLERANEILLTIKQYKRPDLFEQYFEWGGSYKYCAQNFLDVCITADMYYVPCCFRLDPSDFNLGSVYDQSLDIKREMYRFLEDNEKREEVCWSCRLTDEILGW